MGPAPEAQPVDHGPQARSEAHVPRSFAEEPAHVALVGRRESQAGQGGCRPCEGRAGVDSRRLTHSQTSVRHSARIISQDKSACQQDTVFLTHRRSWGGRGRAAFAGEQRSCWSARHKARCGNGGDSRDAIDEGKWAPGKHLCQYYVSMASVTTDRRPRFQPRQRKASGEGGDLLPLGTVTGEKRRAPVLVFGRWRLAMSDDQAARLEALIQAHCDESGSPFGLVERLLRDL